MAPKRPSNPKGAASEGLSLDEARRRRRIGPAAVAALIEGAEPVPPQFSDEALALEFSRRYGDRLRYVAVWSKWLIWDGQHWVTDATLRVFDLVRGVCREAAGKAGDPRVAEHCASASTVAAVERLARADRRHAATVEMWDADPFLLNTPGGVVDLRTGKTVPHSPDLHMTKITAVAPGGNCPAWRRFLTTVTSGDKALEAFLARVIGYSLTGVTKEHALFFFYGSGGNGKGVFLNSVSHILRDYAVTAPIETFMSSGGDRHPTDLAGLRGARVVTAQETEEGRRWAENKIKSLTGGDPISARFMRQDFFTFVPQFKLVIAGNHKPGLRNVDEAIRRRLHLIPFTVTIPAAERDPDLPEKLKAEWPGILAWAIKGCLEWQRLGLAPPPAVTDATAEYMEAEDSFSLWMAECLTPSTWAVETSTDLFTSWRRWAEAAGEFPGTQKRHSQNLMAKGAISKRQHGGRVVFEGFSINRPKSSGEAEYDGCSD
jgi:putative DNA primase/helicase